MTVISNEVVRYRFKDFFIVLACILLSKSLYYETYGNNLLLGVFLAFLIATVKPTKLKINKFILFYILCFIFLVSANPETKLSSLIVLLLRLVIAAYVVHIISFRTFSIIFSKILVFLCVVSLPFYSVIYFNIPSVLPDFVGLDDRLLRNFIFFGLWEGFITHGTYRNSGLWWEPGAFQVFINVAFIFALINQTINKKMYAVFAITIISTLSTTGVLVFVLLSVIFWKNVISNSRNKLFYLFIVILFSVAVVVIAIPFILIKFGGGDAAETSLSFLSRYYDLVISFNLLKENLLLGYGFGSQIENAIPYAVDYMGEAQHKLINPTGADGLTMFFAQCGIFSLAFLFPFLFPKYCSKESVISRLLITISLILMFNTENFTFHLIFILLSFYGLIGRDYRLKNVRTVVFV